MSSTSTRVTEQHFAYLAERTARDDDFLLALKRAARDAGIPEIWISPEQASLMQILLRLARAERVIEVGTLAGYSAIAMARALPPGGRVDTLELDPRHAAFAADWAARSDAAERIAVHQGAGADLLPRFEPASADAFFIDADKEGYPTYLRQARRILRPGGLLMVDNAFAFGQLFAQDADEASVAAIRAFNDELAAVPDFQSVIVPIGDGLWVGVRRAR